VTHDAEVGAASDRIIHMRDGLVHGIEVADEPSAAERGEAAA
jgi:ABC-type lipoprotein export system ATPase subunit